MGIGMNPSLHHKHHIRFMVHLITLNPAKIHIEKYEYLCSKRSGMLISRTQSTIRIGTLEENETTGTVPGEKSSVLVNIRTFCY